MIEALISGGVALFLGGVGIGAKMRQRPANGKPYVLEPVCMERHKASAERFEVISAEMLRVRDSIHELRDLVTSVHAIVKQMERR